MQNETIARRYAAAVFSLATEQNSVDAVGRDLRAASNAIAANDDARRFFISPVIDRAEKANVLTRTFGDKIGEIALHTLLLLVRKRREALLSPIVTEYEKLQLAQSGREPLQVVSARELAPDELNKIVERLSRVYGKRFEVTRRVDPALLGGVRITMGDRSIDGSIAGRLDELSRELHSREAAAAAAAARPS
jgi:F-type H+-transporting ATPase subunit delta